MKKYDLEQTKFSVEKPLFDTVGSYPEPEYEEIKQKTPLLKRRKVVLALVILFTVIVMIILLIVNAIIQQRKKVQVPEPSPTITEQSIEVGPLLKRVEVAKEELKEADPTKNELVFPALDYDIRLDD